MSASSASSSPCGLATADCGGVQRTSVATSTTDCHCPSPHLLCTKSLMFVGESRASIPYDSVRNAEATSHEAASGSVWLKNGARNPREMVWLRKRAVIPLYAAVSAQETPNYPGDICPRRFVSPSTQSWLQGCNILERARLLEYSAR